MIQGLILHLFYPEYLQILFLFETRLVGLVFFALKQEVYLRVISNDYFV